MEKFEEDMSSDDWAHVKTRGGSHRDILEGEGETYILILFQIMKDMRCEI